MEKFPGQMLGSNVFEDVGHLIFTSNCFCNGRFSAFETVMGWLSCWALCDYAGRTKCEIGSRSFLIEFFLPYKALLQLSFFESSVFDTCCACSTAVILDWDPLTQN